MTDDKTRAEYEAGARALYERNRELLRSHSGRRRMPAWDSDNVLPEVRDRYLDDARAVIESWQVAKERYGQPTPEQGWVQHQFWIDSDGNKHSGIHPSLIGMIATKEQKHEQ